MELQVTQRNGTSHVILFDDEDADLLAGYHWGVWRVPHGTNLYYATANTVLPSGRRGHVKMHQLVLGRDVDHINHNGLDNRRSNLRVATRSQQGGNRRPNHNSRSPYKGVNWHTHNQKWQARIQSNRHLGYFDNEIDAAKAYDQAARELWGDFAHLNFSEKENIHE